MYTAHGANAADQTFARKTSDAELMHQRWPVGLGPSSKTWPWWPPQRAQSTSSRTMPKLVSEPTLTRSAAITRVKLGQPVPDSNLSSDRNSARPQPAHS